MSDMELTLSSLCCCRVSLDTFRGRSSESTCKSDHSADAIKAMDKRSINSKCLSHNQSEVTHHSFDEVQVLGHHVVEVVCDENSPDKQLCREAHVTNESLKLLPLQIHTEYSWRHVP